MGSRQPKERRPQERRPRLLPRVGLDCSTIASLDWAMPQRIKPPASRSLTGRPALYLHRDHAGPHRLLQRA
jgi:hypothetical protein